MILYLKVGSAYSNEARKLVDEVLKLNSDFECDVVDIDVNTSDGCEEMDTLSKQGIEMYPALRIPGIRWIVGVEVMKFLRRKLQQAAG